MTQSQAEILDKFDKTIDAVGIADYLAKAKLIKQEGKPLIRMIIFYIILPLLNCGKLSPACKAAHMSLSALCRMLNNTKYLWNKLFTLVSYDMFFAFLADYQAGDASYRSRHCIVLIGDDTLWPRSDECQSEKVKKLFDYAMGCYRKGSNPVVLHCRIGDVDIDFPIDIRVWQPNDSPQYKSKDDLLRCMLNALAKEAERRGVSIAGLNLAIDGGYTHQDVVDTARDLKLRLVGKPRCDSPFEIAGEMETPKELIETTTELRKSTQLPDNVIGYQRFYGSHHLLGEGLLVLVEYRKEDGTLHREIIFCTHSTCTGPTVIKLKASRWQIEVCFRDTKQTLAFCDSQVQDFVAIVAHVHLRFLAYLLLALYRYRYCRRTTTIGMIGERLQIPLLKRYRVKA